MKTLETFVRVLQVASFLQTRKLLCTLTCITGVAYSAGVVTSPTEANLRAAMAGGGTVTFACDGVIALANTITNDQNTTLDAAGHSITISGSNAVRVFFVKTNTTFTTIGLTIVSGRSDAGAAIFNGGIVQAVNTTFFGNVASNAPIIWPFLSSGGAIFNAGTCSVSRCSFLQNQAIGWAFQTPAPEAGVAQGGAVCNVGTLTIESSTFFGNSAYGRWGGNGQDWLGSPGSPGAAAYGGAIFNSGTAALVNSTIVSNTCTGGGGGWGGCGPYTMHGLERIYYGPGGRGGNGGDGFGGGVFSAANPINVTNCTIAHNVTSGAPGGFGGGGSPPGTAGINGATGGSLQVEPLSPIINNVLAGNSPSNCSGTITDCGRNLSSDNSSGFTNSSSLVNLNPLLGPVAENGGPTLTLALLPGSPAIDAADTAAAPPTDQRGLTRPHGPTADIGAYEYAPLLRIGSQGNSFIIQLRDGVVGQPCRLFTGTTLTNWVCVETNLVDPEGAAVFQPAFNANDVSRFYRVAMP